MQPKTQAEITRRCFSLAPWPKSLENVTEHGTAAVHFQNIQRARTHDRSSRKTSDLFQDENEPSRDMQSEHATLRIGKRHETFQGPVKHVTRPQYVTAHNRTWSPLAKVLGGEATRAVLSWLPWPPSGECPKSPLTGSVYQLFRPDLSFQSL